MIGNGQIGSFVPASSASVRIFDQLFSRVGMRDSLETNASSFTKEVRIRSSSHLVLSGFTIRAR